MRAIALLLMMVTGQAAANIAGHWEGSIKLPAGELKISLDLKGGGPGTELTGSISIPQQGAKDLALAAVTETSAGEVTWTLPSAPGTPRFTGKLSADGSRIEGTLAQGGASLPCVLERKADPGVAARQALGGEFDAIVQDGMKKLEVPGIAIAIVKGKEVIYSKGFGFRDVEKQLPVTPETLFAIGSSTKAFTTFVLGTLADEGKVEWEKPVRTYIPWFKLSDPGITEQLSVRDTVTHRSGLPRHDLLWYNNYDVSRESLVRRLPYLEFTAGLREKWQYNNLMYLTAGYLIEVLTGKSWEQAVRERVLQPLAMQRTNFSVFDSQKDTDFALPYAKRDGKVTKIPFRPITNIGPAGSINSSVAEMARWVTVHLNGGRFGAAKLAEASTVADMHKAHMVTGGTSTEPGITGGEYGLGWLTDNYRGHRRVEHGGNIDGFSANVVLFPSADLGMVVLTNMNGTALRGLITQVAADRILGLTAVDWIGQAAARRAQAEKESKEGEKKKESVRVSGTSPSHKLSDYAGEYEHPGYGLVKVTMAESGKLETAFNGIRTPLEHWHYDTFHGGKGSDPVFTDMPFHFQTDPDGYIASVSTPFEASVKPIVFSRKPDSRLSDPSYLSKLAGEYLLLGRTITIGLKGKALVLNQPGAPPQDLLPALHGGFEIKQARVVSLHFVMDGNGGSGGIASAIEIRQPGTVLTAKRK